jgi:hypothetical protein
VYPLKYETLDGLKNLVNDFPHEMHNEVVRKFCRTFFRRAQPCIKLKGGHFEHLNSRAINMHNFK